MREIIEAATPYLVFVTLLAATVTSLGVLWAKVLGPLLGQTLLKSINDRLAAMEARQHKEYENGVPYGDPKYVPMRRAFDNYQRSDAARWARHDADADLVRARLGIEATAVRDRLEEAARV